MLPELPCGTRGERVFAPTALRAATLGSNFSIASIRRFTGFVEFYYLPMFDHCRHPIVFSDCEPRAMIV
jgi:hypothetical protein